jgi:hypothetical protein
MGDMCRPRHMQLKAAEVSHGGGSLLILSSFASDLGYPHAALKTRKPRCLPEKPKHPPSDPIFGLRLSLAYLYTIERTGREGKVDL